MALSDDDIRMLLAKLADREWPEVWSSDESEANRDYYGSSHRYRLNTVLSEAEVARFEREHGIALPSEYRHFLTKLGNGGAGPYFGIESLGMLQNGDPMPQEMLDELSLTFDPDLAEEWDGEDYVEGSIDVMQGTMIICTEGCALWYRLVVSGPDAGEIWVDPRADGNYPDVVVGEEGESGFREWYENWLLECVKKWLPR